MVISASFGLVLLGFRCRQHGGPDNTHQPRSWPRQRFTARLPAGTWHASYRVTQKALQLPVDARQFLGQYSWLRRSSHSRGLSIQARPSSWTWLCLMHSITGFQPASSVATDASWCLHRHARLVKHNDSSTPAAATLVATSLVSCYLWCTELCAPARLQDCSIQLSVQAPRVFLIGDGCRFCYWSA